MGSGNEDRKTGFFLSVLKYFFSFLYAGLNYGIEYLYEASQKEMEGI